MNDRKRHGRPREEGHIHRLAGARRLELISSNWHWLDALGPSDLDSDLIKSVEERAERSAVPL